MQDLAGMVRGISRMKMIFLLILILWFMVTMVDFYSTDFRVKVPFPKEKIALSKDRQLLLSTITESLQQEEEYEDIDEESDTLPESLNIPGETVSNQSLNTESGNIYSEEEGFKSWWLGQAKLKENVRKVCDKYGQSLNTHVPLKEFMFDSNSKLLFCRNAKVGTTTWLQQFLELSQYKKNILMKEFGANYSKKLHRTVPGLFKITSLRNTNIINLAEHTTSFSMVRHPFERLVSAYQDKLVDQTDPFYTRVVNHIVNTYGAVTFENFVHMILDKSRRQCRQMNKCGLDKHWKPFISRCGYCNIPYKVIAKAENFAEDQKFIGRLANIDFKPIKTHTSSGGSTKEQAKKYFSQLSLDIVKKLYNVYKVDFEMFGYSPQMYYDYAVNDVV